MEPKQRIEGPPNVNEHWHIQVRLYQFFIDARHISHPSRVNTGKIPLRDLGNLPLFSFTTQ